MDARSLDQQYCSQQFVIINVRLQLAVMVASLQFMGGMPVYVTAAL